MNNDLISRSALLKELRDWGRSLDSLSENVLMAAIECVCERIEEVPTVDAVPMAQYQAMKELVVFVGERHPRKIPVICNNCGILTEVEV